MIPKPHRIKNEPLLKRIKNNGPCQMPECQNGDIDPHHIKTVGSGGNDESENIVRLCWQHHVRAHSGELKKDYLRELSLKRIEEEGE